MINYPLGANTPDAPWNQEEVKEKQIDVTVSIVLSKTFRINVDDYKVESSDKNSTYYDYSDCDLKKAVSEQVVLPYEAHKYIPGNTEHGKAAIKDLENWNVDDFEINEE